MDLPPNWKPLDDTPYRYGAISNEIVGKEPPVPKYEEELRREMPTGHLLWACEVEAVAYCKDDINELLFRTSAFGMRYSIRYGAGFFVQIKEEKVSLVS